MMLNDAIYVKEFRKKTVPYPVNVVHHRTDSDRLEGMYECVSTYQYSGQVFPAKWR